MKACDHKIKLTKEEEKALSESVLKILLDGFDIIRQRFPQINEDLEEDSTENENNIPG